jgi:anhydro-N-acetylmuramic acid kinase
MHCRPRRAVCPQAEGLYVFGGGAHNLSVLARLRRDVPQCQIATTAALEVDPDWVEALASNWLAKLTLDGRPGILAAVTVAAGERVPEPTYPA